MIRRPQWLNDPLAVGFWERNAKHLIESNMLDEKDTEAFAQLCKVFALMQQCDSTADSKQALRFNGLQKLFQSYLKQFNMLPFSRKKSNLEAQIDPNDAMERRIQDAKSSALSQENG